MPRRPSYATALRKALAALDQQPPDGAAVRLAYGYAQALDDGGDLGKLGPQLLTVLGALGMTPAARAAAVPPKEGDRHGDSPPAASGLDELRARRAARQH